MSFSQLPLSLFAIAGAYLLGSVPFAILSSKLFGLADPRSYGSGNPGATNVLRGGSRLAAVCTLVGDSMKGWLAVCLAQMAEMDRNIIGLVAVVVFLGHLFPLFLKFKGGKGVATAAGVLLAIDPWMGLAALGCWLAVILAWRYVSLASVAAALAAPVYAFFFQKAYTLPVALIAVALIVKHRQNLERLKNGTEPRLGVK